MDIMSSIIIILKIAVPLLYCIVSIGYAVIFVRNRVGRDRALKYTQLVAILAHTLLLGLFWYQEHNFPLETVTRGLFFCSWILSIFTAALHHRFREPSFAAFLFPINFLFSFFTILFIDKGVALPPSMRSYYYAIHVSLTFAAYACFTLSFVVSIMFLMQHHAIRNKTMGPFFKRLPSLEVMNASVMQADAAGLFLLIAGIVMGFVWINIGVGASANVNVKIGLAILTAVAYFIEHIARIGKGWEGQRACLISIAGFILVIGTLLVGRHGY